MPRKRNSRKRNDGFLGIAVLVAIGIVIFLPKGIPQKAWIVLGVAIVVGVFAFVLYAIATGKKRIADRDLSNGDGPKLPDNLQSFSPEYGVDQYSIWRD